MSAFEQNWPVTSDLAEQEQYIASGVSILRDRLILPEDNRWEIAYGLLAMGGKDAAVLVEGDPGTGKTDGGNNIIGDAYRLDIASDDRAASIEGYVSPTNSKDWIPGKLNLNSNDIRIFLNEVGHLGNTGPLHKYWDGDEVFLGGHKVDVSNAVLYSTTNFPDGRRTKSLDPAFRSRQAVVILSGDSGAEIAPKIHGHDIRSEYNGGVKPENGLLPSPELRRALREQVVRANPLSNEAGAYVSSVIDNLNCTGMLAPIGLTDARMSRGWQQVVRARRLVNGTAHKGEVISAYDLMNVAPLALGSVALLSNQGSAVFEERLGYIERPSAHDRAVFARRLIAATAFNAYSKGIDPDAIPSSMALHAHLDKSSFAAAPGETGEPLSHVLHAAVVRGVDLTKGADYEQQASRSGSRRRTR